ncbi:UDP-3-O-acyl-N-acetylglucosamine deacetylase [Parvularcula sp. LCG005]|uniref:UDP-3-O-acyl-N-acetylglucosamine deacetylase n=1 Tax=Parvularcula sp. LCG005 TaxID=3078805 RepID=UPI002943355D|nr:UDP-3-O-acyl-N-acetylglucosamine deacetylase [Parvularcula sp. LCG005]WOI52542.1 UDP-3-O-acyl-N-acetylglucosamine deacetylase [Parvularcula sp. LCG005]
MFDMTEDMSAGARAMTVRTSVSCDSIGLHTGRSVSMTIMPAPAGTGILFRRRDLLANGTAATQMTDLERISIKATPMAVTATTLGTVISNRHGVSVSTVEHIMAAFAGCGVDHAIVELDGPEIPIMDGSAEPFVAMIDSVGLRPLATSRVVWRLNAPVIVEKGDSVIEAVPLGLDEPSTTEIDVTVAFNDPAIGRQHLRIDGHAADFRSAIAAARTFCDLKDVEMMRAQGLALGGSLDNAIVVSDGQVLNEGGLRFDGEFVRHKALDLIGDLYLLGAPLAARIKAVKPGHDLNTRFARAVIEQGAASIEMVPAGDASDQRARA